MVENSKNQDTRFEMVGAGYMHHEPKIMKPTLGMRLKGKPIMSMVVLMLIIVGCIFAPLITNHDPSRYYYEALSKAPDTEFFFGTDSMGRDLYSIMFFGGRSSLVIGILGAAIIAVLGISYGTVSGTAGDKTDAVLMRITEMCGAIPSMLMVLIITAIFPAENVISMSIVVGITGWFGLARITRTEVRQIRNTEYVLYARSTGGRFGYVMRRHLIPNFLSAIMFVVVSGISSCMTTESTLSFLGLGLPLDVLSWGSMLSLANKALITNDWWVIIIPGVFLVVTLICITDLGNFLRKETNKKCSNL